PRAHNVLVPGGRVALLGHVVVRRPGEPEVYAETADLHERFSPGNPGWGHPPFEDEVRATDDGWGSVDDPGGLFVLTTVRWYPTVQWFDGSGFADLLLSQSMYRKLDPGVREPLETAAAALAAARAAPETTPRDLALAYGRLGLLYHICDLRPAASAALENALRLDSTDFRWPYALGIVRRGDGALDEARRRLLQAAELAPTYAPLQLRLGDLLYDQGEAGAAEQRYRQALGLDPTLAGAEAGLGRIAYDRGESATAAAHFERALALQPTATALHHQLGLAYRALGERDKARAELAANRGGRLRIPDPVLDDAAAQLDSSQAHFSAGVDLMRRGEPQLALGEFERALAGRPDDPFLAYNLALAHLGLADEAAAERWLRRALELDPDFRNAQVNLGELLAADGRLAEAADHFRRAHEVDPDDVSAHVAWAKALAALGERELALQELEAVIERAPEGAEALLTRGIVEAQLGREAAAEASFRGAAAVGSAAASAELGLLLERQDRV
ncbi:MAG: tetratricopeptide repeat protein, partial [Thermoanaerobaculia bacterium]